MSIAPIEIDKLVPTSPEQAFNLFVSRMTDWWPQGMTMTKAPFVGVSVEPRVGGRWFERADDGREANIGQVLAWEPPRLLLLSWQVNGAFQYDPSVCSEVEITFEDAGPRKTRVKLVHRGLETLGTNAVVAAEMMRNGWPTHMANFEKLASASASWEESDRD